MSICVDKLSYSYGKRKALDNVSFSAENGELLAVLGPNGAGKSTLFQCVLGLKTDYEGLITVDGKNMRDLSVQELSRSIAYIPQTHSPVFNFSVFDVVLMGTTSQVSTVNIPGKKQKELAEAALERLGLSNLRNRGYTQISGGERQLVLIARALAQNTKILIMDEPTANLDYGNQLRILSHIKKLAKEGYTVVQSTHTPDQAFMFADKILALSGGCVLSLGTPAEVISPDLIKQLYKVDVVMESLYDDKFRVSLPKSIICD